MFGRKVNEDNKTIQLQNEIRGLELRKESITSVLQNDIFQLQNEKSNLLQQAGAKAYENWQKRINEPDVLEIFWTQIEELEKHMKEKKLKKTEMKERYNEEISLLQKGLNSYSGIEVNGNLTNQINAGLTCPQCGKSIDRTDEFCGNCGKKLK